METSKNIIEPVLEKAEAYGKASFELLKLKALKKTADLSANLGSRVLLISIIVLFILMLSVAAALWLGDILGKTHYGFFIVASFYALIGLVLIMIHPFIKARINNVIIKQLFK